MQRTFPGHHQRGKVRELWHCQLCRRRMGPEAKYCRLPPKARKAGKWIPSWNLQKRMQAWDTLIRAQWDPALKNRITIHLCCFRPLHLSQFVIAATGDSYSKGDLSYLDPDNLELASLSFFFVICLLKLYRVFRSTIRWGRTVDSSQIVRTGSHPRGSPVQLPTQSQTLSYSIPDQWTLSLCLNPGERAAASENSTYRIFSS